GADAFLDDLDQDFLAFAEDVLDKRLGSAEAGSAHHGTTAAAARAAAIVTAVVTARRPPIRPAFIVLLFERPGRLVAGTVVVVQIARRRFVAQVLLDGAFIGVGKLLGDRRGRFLRRRSVRFVLGGGAGAAPPG